MSIEAQAGAPVGRDELRAAPSRTGLPLIGTTLQVLSGEIYTNRDRYDQLGPVTWNRAFGIKGIMVQGPDAAGEVLQNRDHAFASGPGWSSLIGPFFKRGLMLLDFEEHHVHRRIMQQAFTADRLAAYLEPMNDTLQSGLASWRDGDRFRFYPAVKQLTLDIATRTFMGAQLGAEADRLNRSFVDCVRAGTAIVRVNVPGLRWSRGLTGRRRLEAFLYPQLPAKRASEQNDLFSALCHARSEDGEQFSDADVVNHMIFLLMAAHDTTTITMSTMAYYLAKYPQWQERCRAESEALGSPTVDYRDLDRLVSLDLVMRESMRMVTAVPGVVRRSVKDTSVAGYFVPRDTQVTVNVHFGHQLAEYWPDPGRFDPERFSDERREDKIHRSAWIPFGGGVHKCIGMHFGTMQVKAAMHQVLQNFEWSVPRGYELPIDWTSLPRPKDGLPVHLVRR
ncbi:MAG: cytochrome P450 [Jatrophihabitantaceae bacterium]